MNWTERELDWEICRDDARAVQPAADERGHHTSQIACELEQLGNASLEPFLVLQADSVERRPVFQHRLLFVDPREGKIAFVGGPETEED